MAHPSLHREAPVDGRFRVQQLLGAGGMGEVWRAHDVHLQRDVALKTVPVGAGPEVRARLLQEARICAELALDGAITLFDRGELADGRPFLVLELLDGPALGHGLDADLQRVLEAARTVGDAHRRGFVHRDLKPSNLGRRGPRTVVLDWGLARPIHRAPILSAEPLTAAGTALGSLGYMAPEIVRGDQADPRADVWSLGAVVHELLTGRPPWRDGSHALLADVLANRLDVPQPAMETVLQRALAVDPDDRFPDGHAFADALEEVLRPAARPRLVGPLLAALFVTGILLVAGALLLLPGTSSDDVQAWTALGWQLAADGRLAEAHATGRQAEKLRTTPEGRGLLVLPEHPAVETLALDCTPVDMLGTDVLCYDDGVLSRVSEDGTPRWSRTIGEASLLRTHGDQVALLADWKLAVLDRHGEETWSHRLRTVDRTFLTSGRLWIQSGREVHSWDLSTGLQRTEEVGEDLFTLMGLDDDRVVLQTAHGAWVVDEAGNRARVEALFSPLRAARIVDDSLVLVDMRGGRAVFDARTLELRGRRQLRGADQLHAAAIGADGTVAASTPHGIQLFVGGEPVVQLDRPGRNLKLHDDGALTFVLDGQLHRWRPGRPTAFHAGAGSTNALRATEDALEVVIGRTLYAVDPATFATTPLHTFAGGPSRGIGARHLVDGTELFDRTTMSVIGKFPVFAELSDGTALAARRWTRGVAHVDGDVVRRFPDAPHIVRMTVGPTGDAALGVGKDARLYRLRPDLTAEVVDEGPVGYVGAGPLGTVVAHGSDVRGPGLHVRLDEPVTALAVGERHIAVGTIGGWLSLFDADGHELWRLWAHQERVNTLAFAGDALFSGSWSAGVRRWDLPD